MIEQQVETCSLVDLVLQFATDLLAEKEHSHDVRWRLEPSIVGRGG